MSSRSVMPDSVVGDDDMRVGSFEAHLDVDLSRTCGDRVIHKVGDGGDEVVTDVPERRRESTRRGGHIHTEAWSFAIRAPSISLASGCHTRPLRTGIESAQDRVPSSDPVGRLIRVLVLPDMDRSPSESASSPSFRASLSRFASNLAFHQSLIVLRHHAVIRAGMPEATVDEHGQPCGRQHDVRRAGQVPPVQPEPETLPWS